MAAIPVHEIADRLWNARLQGSPLPPLTETHPNLSLTEAYRVSQINFHRRTRIAGNLPIGRKIGLTSRAVQLQLGVGQPDYGYLTQDMQLANGATLPIGSLIQGRVEGEVAFVLRKGLRGPGVTVADVSVATDYVVACIEIIDSRIQDWNIKVEDTVADNASSAYFVLGDRKRKLDGVDLRMAGMTLRKNGVVESTGIGAACLDHPIQAVSWLANALAVFEEGLKPGDIVLSGAYGPVVPFGPGDRCEVEINGLGKVSCAYEGIG